MDLLLGFKKNNDITLLYKFCVAGTNTKLEKTKTLKKVIFLQGQINQLVQVWPENFFLQSI